MTGMSCFVCYLKNLDWDLNKVMFFLFDIRRTVRQVFTLPLCWRMATPCTLWTSSFRTVSCKIRRTEWSTCLSMTGKRISEALTEQRNIANIITFSILTLKHFFILYNKKNRLHLKKRRITKGKGWPHVWFLCILFCYTEFCLLYNIMHGSRKYF